MPFYRTTINVPIDGGDTWKPTDLYQGDSRQEALQRWTESVKTIVKTLGDEQEATGGPFNERPISPTVTIYEDFIPVVTFDPQAWAITMQPGWEELLGASPITTPKVN